MGRNLTELENEDQDHDERLPHININNYYQNNKNDGQNMEDKNLYALVVRL